MRYIVALLIGLVLSSDAWSQKFRAGLIGGLVTSQVDGDSYGGYNKAGFMGGFFVGHTLSASGKLSGSFELLYIQKGSRKAPRPDKGDYSSFSLKLNYAEVPLLLRYAFTSKDSAGNSNSKFDLEGGLSAGFLVDHEEEDTFGPVINGSPFEKIDLMALVGLHYKITTHLSFQIRTGYSLLPVRKGSQSSYYYNWTHNILKPGYYNNLVMFAGRYTF